MTFHEYLSKAVQDDAQLAAERGRLLLVARRAHRARRMRAGLAGPVRQRLTRLLFRRAPAQRIGRHASGGGFAPRLGFSASNRHGRQSEAPEWRRNPRQNGCSAPIGSHMPTVSIGIPIRRSDRHYKGMMQASSAIIVTVKSSMEYAEL
jgi:hypothetical protein